MEKVCHQLQNLSEQEHLSFFSSAEDFGIVMWMGICCLGCRDVFGAVVSGTGIAKMISF